MGVLVWLESLPLSVWVHESPSVWAQPTVLTLHTMGMGVLVGASWVLDLRLLGINRNMPLSAFRWVFRAVAVGLIVNVVTGILLFAQRATKPAVAATVVSTETINLNTATAAQIATLPGIGPKTADLVVQYRTKNGPFKKIEEVMNVRGIGEKSFLKIKDRLTVAAGQK